MEKNSKIWLCLRKINKKFVKNVGGEGKIHNKVAQKLLFLVVGAALMFVFSPHKTAFADKTVVKSGVNIGNLQYTLYNDGGTLTATVTGLSDEDGTDKTTMAPPATVSYDGSNYDISGLTTVGDTTVLDGLFLDCDKLKGLSFSKLIIGSGGLGYWSTLFENCSIGCVEVRGRLTCHHWFVQTNPIISCDIGAVTVSADPQRIVLEGCAVTSATLSSSETVGFCFASCSIDALCLSGVAGDYTFHRCEIRLFDIAPTGALRSSSFDDSCPVAIRTLSPDYFVSWDKKPCERLYCPCTTIVSPAARSHSARYRYQLLRYHPPKDFIVVTSAGKFYSLLCNGCLCDMTRSDLIPALDLSVTSSAATFSANASLAYALSLDGALVAEGEGVTLPGTKLTEPKLDFSTKTKPTFDKGGAADVQVIINDSSTTLEDETVCAKLEAPTVAIADSTKATFSSPATAKVKVSYGDSSFTSTPLNVSTTLSTPTYTLSDFTPPTVPNDAKLKIPLV